MSFVVYESDLVCWFYFFRVLVVVGVVGFCLIFVIFVFIFICDLMYFWG